MFFARIRHWACRLSLEVTAPAKHMGSLVQKQPPRHASREADDVGKRGAPGKVEMSRGLVGYSCPCARFTRPCLEIGHRPRAESVRCVFSAQLTGTGDAVGVITHR